MNICRVLLVVLTAWTLRERKAGSATTQKQPGNLQVFNEFQNSKIWKQERKNTLERLAETPTISSNYRKEICLLIPVPGTLLSCFCPLIKYKSLNKVSYSLPIFQVDGYL